MSRNLPTKPQDAPEVPVTEEAPEETPAEELGLTPTLGIGRKRKAPKIPVKQYRVGRGPLPTGGWTVVFNGSRTELAMGKIIDERQYDIRKLKLMGVELIDAGETEG